MVSEVRDMLLHCPMCGSETFFLEQEDDTVYLSVDERGRAVDVSPEGADISLQASDVIYCTNCPWCGEVSELERD